MLVVFYKKKSQMLPNGNEFGTALKVNHKVRNELNIQNNNMNVSKLLSEPFEGVSIKDNIRGIVD